MAKISRHGGATYAEGEAPPADEPHPEATGAGTEPEPEAVEVEPDGTLSEPVEGDGSGEPLPEAEAEGLYLPPQNAKVGQWRHALVKAGLHEPYADTLTKDALVELGRALADGGTTLDDYGLPTGDLDPGDDWREPEPDDSDLDTGA
jgi:hypothetical protein